VGAEVADRTRQQNVGVAAHLTGARVARSPVTAQQGNQMSQPAIFLHVGAIALVAAMDIGRETRRPRSIDMPVAVSGLPHRPADLALEGADLIAESEHPGAELCVGASATRRTRKMVT